MDKKSTGQGRVTEVSYTFNVRADAPESPVELSVSHSQNGEIQVQFKGLQDAEVNLRPVVEKFFSKVQQEIITELADKDSTQNRKHPPAIPGPNSNRVHFMGGGRGFEAKTEILPKVRKGMWSGVQTVIELQSLSGNKPDAMSSVITVSDGKQVLKDAERTKIVHDYVVKAIHNHAPAFEEELKRALQKDLGTAATEHHARAIDDKRAAAKGRSVVD